MGFLFADISGLANLQAAAMSPGTAKFYYVFTVIISAFGIGSPFIFWDCGAGVNGFVMGFLIGVEQFLIATFLVLLPLIYLQCKVAYVGILVKGLLIVQTLAAVYMAVYFSNVVSHFIA